ncbi:spore germination protein [Paenibacillus sepulcri]
MFREVFGESDDLVIREFRISGQFDAAIVFFSTMVDTALINDDIMKPLMNPATDQQNIDLQGRDLIKFVWKNYVYVAECSMEDTIGIMLEGVNLGNTLLCIDGCSDALLLESRMVEKRAIEQPQTEMMIRGAREGYIEVLDTNLNLLRGRLLTVDMRVKLAATGNRAKSQVAVCYLEGVADPKLVEEAMSRLSKISTDAILDAGYIEQFIEDYPLSPFPQIQNTERPDKTAAALLEGRVAILVDGSPFALIVPAIFSQFYQTLDDYTERFLMGTLVRMIRLLALIFSLVFPSLYVAVISYNPELLPTDFAVAVAGGRAGVPFPAVIEVLLIELSMEVLREATIRLPQLIGGALSIVGVLVVGQAAVSAGFSSPITIVIVALTTIGSFATPAYNAAIALRMLRFPILILAGTFGLYGVMAGLILIMNHLLFLESFGVPYMYPIVPGNWQAMKDTLIRGPLWWMNKRPSYLQPGDRDRLPNDHAKVAGSHALHYIDKEESEHE